MEFGWEEEKKVSSSLYCLRWNSAKRTNKQFIYTHTHPHSPTERYRHTLSTVGRCRCCGPLLYDTIYTRCWARGSDMARAGPGGAIWKHAGAWNNPGGSVGTVGQRLWFTSTEWSPLRWSAARSAERDDEEWWKSYFPTLQPKTISTWCYCSISRAPRSPRRLGLGNRPLQNTANCP